MHKVVCTQKTLAIGFDNFPKRICSYEGHDKLNDIIVKAIPEVDSNGLEGGIYSQCKAIWITVDCNGLTEEREKQINTDFLYLVRRFCRLRS